MRWSRCVALSAYFAAMALASCNNELDYSSPTVNHVPPSPPPTARPPSISRHAAQWQALVAHGGRSRRVIAR